MQKSLFTGSFCAFSSDDEAALENLLQRICHPGCRIVEIGSWLGNGSTQVILKELGRHDGSRLLCVDTWQGSPGVQRHSAILADYDVLATFRANTQWASDRCDFLVSSSTNAARLIADATFDLIFIDADHRYEAVRADIAAWLPKLASGGIICGHDCEMRVTDEHRPALMAGLDSDAVEVMGAPFRHVHAGAIVAVHEAFDGRASLFAERGRSSIWFYQPSAAVRFQAPL